MCFKPNYFQLEYIYVTTFKTKRFLKCYIYVCVCVCVCKYNSEDDNET